jgi:hypothetical protein
VCYKQMVFEVERVLATALTGVEVP